MIKCRACGGTGTVCGFWDGTDPKTGRRIGGFGELGCPTCHGTGVIDADQAARMSEGARRRTDRLRRGLSLREEAVRLGITMAELSALEHGQRKEGGGAGETLDEARAREGIEPLPGPDES